MALSDFMKTKVSEWLREEGFFYEEIVDPDTRFNFSTKVAGLAFDIIQDISRDVVVVRSTLIFNDEQMAMIHNMSPKRRDDFLWDIRFMLLGNNEISGFRIKPNLEHMEVLIQSRGIFQDAFTKDRLLHSILTVHKAVTMVIWMLQRASGGHESVVDSNLYM
jgi:hypothetical protein